MRLVLIDPENPLWRNALGVVAAVIIVPIAMFVKLVMMPFERPTKRTSGEVARYIRGFLDGSGDEGDWDAFACIPIADSALESIRQRAASVEYPVSDEGRSILMTLLVEAETIAEKELVLRR